ncbi:hypothetical protein OIU79_000823 [Salix purpurea]|uniref:Uncharacterized protein n=1 Tax=Salix purpurea TaxID=77065 RepID=A0A9Q0V2Z2_SALPP|nr:hypothetical protein OIU79_000823 [Salix purpurea]
MQCNEMPLYYLPFSSTISLGAPPPFP